MLNREDALRICDTVLAHARTAGAEDAIVSAQSSVESHARFADNRITTSGRSDAINEAWLLHGSPGEVYTHLSRVLALTPDDVRAAAARWLDPAATYTLHYLAESPR